MIFPEPWLLKCSSISCLVTGKASILLANCDPTNYPTRKKLRLPNGIQDFSLFLEQGRKALLSLPARKRAQTDEMQVVGEVDHPTSSGYPVSGSANQIRHGKASNPAGIDMGLKKRQQWWWWMDVPAYRCGEDSRDKAGYWRPQSWLVLEKKRNGPVCSGQKVKISGNKGCKGCLFVCLFLGIWR